MPIEETEYSEKREFMRLFINAPLQYKLEDHEDWSQGTGKDLSATGMAFTINEAVQAGDLIEVRIKPGTEVTPALRAIVKVLRVTEQDDGLFEVSTIIDKLLP